MTDLAFDGRDEALVFDLTFLGTGTSTGVPVIGCNCDICQSTDPRDTRLRSSILIESGGQTILVDTSPDLRQQMLTTRTTRIDAVLFTHAHSDHTAGLDELRRYNIMQEARIPVWATPEVGAEIGQRFAYAFDHSFSFFGGKPDLDLHTFDPQAPFDVCGVPVVPIPIQHGWLPIVGFRFGDVAYLTDVKTIPEPSLPLLEGVDLLVLTALRRKPHVAHMNLDEALAAIELIAPQRALLTHIAHDLGLHRDVEAGLPSNVALARDGLRMTGLR
jgi:phosphoribosyl 1,2-cyclic phosphate phosphodiesterase